MAVFSYIGGSVSLATGSYGNLAVRKGSQVSVAATPTTSARSFTEATPASGLLEPVNRVHQVTKVAHTSGYSATKLNFNTTEPYNSGAYSTSQYYTPYNTVFNDTENYNTSTSNGGEYWAHAQGYINSEIGTAIAVDKNRNAWVVGSTDYDSCTVTSITASLTAAGFTNSTTATSGGTNDSGYFYIGGGVLPFNHNIFGLNNSNIVVHTNSWISFQPLVNTTQTTFSGTNPSWANIQIGAGEASCQRVFHGSFGTAPNRTYRVKFEGTNATTGTIGSPNMVWEFIVYESNPNIFDIQIGTWTPPTTNFNGISDGTTYFPGSFAPAANTGWRFNTGTVTAGASGSNITLVKYSTKGVFHKNKDFFPYTGTDDLEVISIGRDGNDAAESIKVGSDGRLYILYTSNSYPYTSGFGDSEIGVIKLDPDYLYKTVNSTRTTSNISDSIVWNKSFGTTNNDSGQSLDLDANDNLYITGFSIGTGQGNNDVVVLKVDKNGSLIWKRTYGAVGGELGQAIKYSPDGNLYVWGISSSSPLINATADFYLLKINGTTGAIIWQKHFNISASTNATVFENTVDVDEYSNVYVCGFAATSPIAYLVSKLDKDGNFKWTRSVGALTGSVDAGTAIKYKKGYLYVGGQDSSTFNNSESYGLGVSKLNPDTGELLSNYVIGGVSSEYAYAIDVDDYGDIYATGAVNTSMVGLQSASVTNALTAKFILDTPQGGFVLSGAAACDRYLNTYRYTSRQEYFDATSIVLQNDLIATGQQRIFVATTSQSQFNFEKEFTFAGSGSLAALVSTVQEIAVSTTQYQHRTNLLSDITKYFRTNISSVTSATSIPNPVTGLTGDTAVYNVVTSSSGAVFPGYLDPRSSTGVFAPNTKVVMSIFAKTNTWSKFKLVAYSSVFGSSGALPNHEIQYDVSLGTATNLQGTNAPLEYGIEPYSNGWYRCWIKLNVRVSSDQSGGSGWFQIKFSTDSSATNSMYWYGPQLQKDVLTSFVENTGTSALSTTAYIYDNNVDTLLTYADNDIVLFSTGGSSVNSYVNPFNKPVQTYRGSSDLSLLSPYEVVFDPNLYTTKIQYKIYNNNLYSTELFPQRFIYSGSGSILLIKQSQSSGTFEVITRLSSYTASTQLIARSGPYTIGDEISLRTGPDSLGITSTSLESYSDLKLTFNPPEDTYLFAISGQHGTRVFVPKWISSGSLFTSASGTAKVTFNPTEDSYLFAVSGAATAKSTKITSGSGSIATNLSATATVVFNPPDDTYLFSISGFSNQKQTNVSLSTGNFINTSGSAITVFSKDAYKYTGSSPSNYISSSNIVFGNEENITKITDGSAKYTFIKGGFIGSGTFTEEPFASQSTAQTALVLINTIIIYNTNAITKLALQYAGKSPTTPFGGLDVVFEELEANAPPQQFKYTGAASVPTTTKAFNGSGNILLSGTGVYTSTKAWMGSGSISIGLTAAASVSFNPPEDTYLYTISGAATAKSTKITSGSGSLFSGGFYSNLQATFNPTEDTYLFAISGTSNIKASGAWLGSGSITTNLSGTAAVAFNPPEDNYLFSVSGASNAKTSSVYLIPTPNILTFSEQIDNASWGKTNTTVQKNVIIAPDGTNTADKLVENTTNGLHIFAKGVGTISGNYTVSCFVKAAERYKGYIQLLGNENAAAFFNLNLGTITGGPGTNTITPYPNGWYRITSTQTFTSGNANCYFVLLNDTGNSSYAGNNTSGMYVWGVKLETGNAATPYVADSGITLYDNNITTSGSAITKAPNRHIGASPIAYYDPSQIVFEDGVDFYATQFKITSNQSVYRYTAAQLQVVFQSSGSLFTSASGTASVTFNPTEDTYLYTISGAAVLKSTSITSGSGSLFSSGFYSNLQATFNPTEDTYLFIVSGTYSNLKASSAWLGSGSISSLSGGAERVAFKPADGTGLFTFSNGYSNLNASSVWVGTGTATFSGAAGIKAPNRHIGASPITYYDPSQIVFEDGVEFYPTQYKIASNQTTYKYAGAPAQVQGGGSLFTSASGAASVRFNPPEDTYLFAISGTNQQSTSISQIGSGSILITGTYSNFQATRAWAGSGSIITNLSATASVTFNPSEDTYLFAVSGSATAKSTSITSGSGSIFSSGFYSNLQATFNPPEDTYLFAISGAYSNLQATRAWVGASPITYYNPLQIVFEDEIDFYPTQYKIASNQTTYKYASAPVQVQGGGSLFTSASGTAKVTFNPPEDTYLFAISGQHGTRVFVPNWISSGSLFTAASGVASVTFNPTEDTYLFAVSGAAVPKSTSSNTGSGSLFVSSSGTAKVTFNPPEDTYLFTVSGSATVKLRDYVWISPIVEFDPYELVINDDFVVTDYIDIRNNIWDSANNIYRSATTQNTTSSNVAVDGSLFTSGSYSNLKASSAWLGSGSITTNLSSTASVTFNPPEDIYLFSVSGAAVPKSTNITSGSGSLFTSASGTAKVTFNPPEDIYLFTVSGTSNVKASSAWLASGSLFTSASGTATVTFNPPEDTYLFAVSGAADSSRTRITSGSGSIKVIPKDKQQYSTTLYFQRTYDLANTFVYSQQSSSVVPVVYPNPINGGASDESFIFTNTVAADSGYITPVTYTGTFAANTTIVTSIFAKANTWDKFSILAYNPPFGANNSLPNQQVSYDLTSAKATNLEAANPPLDWGIIPYGNGWYRCWIKTYNAVASDQSTLPCWFQIRFAGGSSVGSSIYLYGPQLQKDVLTSYVNSIYSSPYSTLAFVELVDFESATYKPANGSGSLFTSASGAAEVSFNPPEDTYLISVSGSATAKSTNITSGSGSITTNLSATAKVTFNPPEDTYLFTITGQHGTRVFVPNWNSSGSLFTSASGTASTTFNPTEDTYLFAISGTAGAKSTNITSGSGSLFSGGFYSNLQATFNPPEDTYLFTVSGQHGTRVFVPNWISTGSLFTSASGVASVTFNPTEDTYLFAISGAATVLVPIKYSGSGSITSSASGSASVTFNPPEDTYLYTISGAAVPKSTSSNAGSGSLFSSGFYSNLQATFNPPEDTYLFTVSGQHGTRVFVPNWISTGSLFTSASGTAKVTFNPPEDTYLFSVSGDVVSTFITSTSGSGSLFVSSSGTAKVTFNPPEDTYLFAVSGTAVPKSTNSTSGSGSITTNLSGTASVTFNPPEDTYLFTVSGQHGTRVFVPNWISTGSLFTAASGTAKVTFNPPEDTYLFTVSGAAAAKSSNITSGSGSLFTSASGTASITFNPPEDTYLFGLSGSASESQTNITAGSGFISVSGQHGSRVFVPNWISQGSITTSASGSASVSFNPTEDTYLFGVSGSSDSKQTNTYPKTNSNLFGFSEQFDNGYWSKAFLNGTITANQTTAPDETITADLYQEGATTTAKYLSKSEFFTQGRQSTISIWAKKSFGTRYLGLVLPTAAFGVAVQAAFTLSDAGSYTINISGTNTSARIIPYPNGWYRCYLTSQATATDSSNIQIRISNSPTDATTTYQGDGTSGIYLWGAKLELGNVITPYVADSGITLYDNFININGTSTTKIINRFSGSGTIDVSNQASASVTFNPTEDTYLFAISGTSNVTASSAWFGSGSITTNLSSTASVTFNPPEDTYLFTVSGAAGSALTRITSGSGSLFTSASGTASVTFNPPEDTYLFTVSGQHGTRVFVPNWNSSGSLFASASGTAKVTFNPPEDTYLFAISGAAGSALTRITSGSGSLFTSSSATAKVTFNPPEDTYLFTITGQHGTRVFVPNWNSSGSLFTSASGTAKVTFNPSEGICLFVVSGVVAEKTTRIYDGISTIISINGEAETILERAVYRGSGLINISASVIVRTVLRERIFTTII